MPGSWKPPATWRRFPVIDAHTAGEPLRVVVGGFPELEGETMMEKRRQASQKHDSLRKSLMWEPRGHADMYGCLLTAPVTSDGDLGVLFFHNEGYSTMCGHGIIGVVKVGLECDLFQPVSKDGLIRLDTPAGRVTAQPHWEGSRVARVSFQNVPSFLLEKDLMVEVRGLGSVCCDIAFGGAFYAYVRASSFGFELRPEEFPRLIDVGMRVKHAVSSCYTPTHPDGDPDLNFLYGTIFVSESASVGAHSRNVCVFADGEVDRSPTGTGVSGRAAIHYSRGELRMGEKMTVESLIGTAFDVQIEGTTTVGVLPAVIPKVTGSAYIVGCGELVIDPSDPLKNGFLVR